MLLFSTKKKTKNGKKTLKQRWDWRKVKKSESGDQWAERLKAFSIGMETPIFWHCILFQTATHKIRFTVI